MALYECVFLTRPDLSQSQVDALAEQYAEIIRENDGEVTKSEYWGLRSLAYRLNKNRKAHYTLMNVAGSSAGINEVERRMRLSEDVVRFLTVRVDKLEEGPSAVLRARASGDDRPRRGGDRGGDRGDRGGDRGGDRRGGGHYDSGRKPQASSNSDNKGD